MGDNLIVKGLLIHVLYTCALVLAVLKFQLHINSGLEPTWANFTVNKTVLILSDTKLAINYAGIKSNINTSNYTLEGIHTIIVCTFSFGVGGIFESQTN